MTLQLSPNFTLAELTKSQAALRRGWANEPPPGAVAALRILCERVLEPVRAHFGRPMFINSGYRSARVNASVGGAASSQHVRGEAADIEIPGVANGAVAAFIAAHLPFDQLILEAYTPGQPASGWVHVSYCAALRHAAMTATPRAGGGMAYVQGLHA